jgi:hypothetical protein
MHDFGDQTGIREQRLLSWAVLDEIEDPVETTCRAYKSLLMGKPSICRKGNPTRCVFAAMGGCIQYLNLPPAQFPPQRSGMPRLNTVPLTCDLISVIGVVWISDAPRSEVGEGDPLGLAGQQ